MRAPFLFGPVLALLLAVPSAQAAPPAPAPASAVPGALSFRDLDLFPRDKLSVEIHLEGSLLHMIANATSKDDPEFASLMTNLKAIHVEVFPLKDHGAAEPLRAKIDRAVRWLEDHGWHSTVRVRDKGEETYIYLKETDGQIVGLAILSVEPGEEAALINVVGKLDPAQIGRLGRNLNIPQLQKVPGGKKPEATRDSRGKAGGDQP